MLNYIHGTTADVNMHALRKLAQSNSARAIHFRRFSRTCYLSRGSETRYRAAARRKWIWALKPAAVVATVAAGRKMRVNDSQLQARGCYIRTDDGDSSRL